MLSAREIKPPLFRFHFLYKMSVSQAKGENIGGANHFWFCDFYFPYQIIFCSIVTLVNIYVYHFISANKEVQSQNKRTTDPLFSPFNNKD